MFNTEIKSGDRLWEDAIYRHVHVNVTGVDINRDIYGDIVKIIFTIENKDRTKVIRDMQCVRNADVRYYRPENLAFKANKIASVIDEVPDYIPDEQIVKWIDHKI